MLAAVSIAAGVVLALVWVRLVPIFEFPDEGVHFKYIVAVYAAGRPVVPRDGTAGDRIPPGRVVPYPNSLEDLTGMSVIAGHREIKAPPEYGSAEYFRGLDAALAPEPQSTLLSPILSRYYPPGYYLLTAAWMGAASLAVHSPTGLMFAARVLSVVLLAVALVLSHQTLRRLGVGPFRSAVLIAITALLPVTDLVCAAVQPDSLSFALVAACLYFSLRFRARSSPSWRWAIPLGLALGLLLMTKFQYFGAVVPAAGGVLLARILGQRIGRPRALRELLWLAVPSVAAIAFQFWLVYRAPLVVIRNDIGTVTQLRDALLGGPIKLTVYLAGHFGFMFQDLTFGREFVTFWGKFGWLDTPLILGSETITYRVWVVVAAFSVLTLGLGIARQGRVLARLLRIAETRGMRRATALLVGNPVVNAYFAFVILMMIYEGRPGLQGRYFVPLLPAVLYMAVQLAPSVLRRPWRNRYQRLLIAGLAGYALLAAGFALPTLQDRYYGTGRALEPLNLSGLARVDTPSRYQLTVEPPFTQRGIDIPPIGLIGVWGWAVDTLAQAPARTVLISVDGGAPQEAVYGDNSPAAVAALGDHKYSRAGFDLVVRVGELSPGWHTVTAQVVSADGTHLYAPGPGRRFLMPKAQTEPR